MGLRPAQKELSQDFVDSFKRERTALAVAEVVREVGLSQLTVAAITRRAKIARNTFYDLFENREAAVRAAAQLGNAKLLAAIDAGADREGSWKHRVVAVIEGLVEVAQEAPALIELSLVHVRGTVGSDVPYDPDLVCGIGGVLRAGRTEAQGPEPHSRAEELLAYAILAVISERLRRREAGPPAILASELAQLAKPPLLEEAPEQQWLELA